MTPGCWNFHSTRPPRGKILCPCRASIHRAVCPYQIWGVYFFLLLVDSTPGLLGSCNPDNGSVRHAFLSSPFTYVETETG